MPSKFKDKVADFNFKEISRGSYEVTYTSPITGNKWTQTTDDKELVEKAKKGINLVKMKFVCKL